MSHKVSSQAGNVPFSWENKPGVSKAACEEWSSEIGGDTTPRLPPPPCPPTEKATRAYFHDLQVPLPPCGFQPPSRSSSKRGLRRQDDPFLTAYKECTKSSFRRGRFGYFGTLRKNMSTIFSCTHSCSVRDDSMVRISQLPISKSEREHDPEV
ncbi:Stimulated by retinoic acid protein [Actinidia chinensis var. chinensis]|uniref:Stimulated by retinoic acid protein n=1 Tax=Actinidia chinensis var. chinensis TaxID=1590841 RepID=A0A2R6Q0M5_ACTCC|nr:Stimulated by retinoic acid protein [Actinidia chinensis var. chinensis]